MTLARAGRPVLKVSDDDPRWHAFRDMDAKLRRLLGPDYYRAIATLRSDLDLSTLEDALKTGRADLVADDVLDDPALMAAFKTAMQEAIVAAGTWAATSRAGVLPATIRIHFDGYNPDAVAYIQRDGARLVQQVSDDVRGLVRAAAKRGLERGVNPVETARTIRDSLGLTAHQWTAVDNYRTALTTLDRTALARELRDRRFDPSVLRAIEHRQHLTPEKVDRLVERYTERYLAYRAETVMRTESIRALYQGQRLAWLQAFREGKAERSEARRYVAVTPGDRTCEFCIATAEANEDGVGFDEPFDTPDGPADGPPFHPDCRCYVFVDVSGAVTPN